MPLWYVTNVNLLASDAQSVQIRAMARSFHGLDPVGFRLYSPVPPSTLSDGTPGWLPVPTLFRRRALRYLEFAARILPTLLAGRPVVFSRDIGVCLLAWLLGLRTTFEIHKGPSACAGLLLRFLSRRSKFRVVTISATLAEWGLSKGFLRRDATLVAHDGVFLDAYDALRQVDQRSLRRELGLSEQQFVIVHSGSIYPGRGEELFEPILKAFPQILLIQVGGRPEDVARVRARCSNASNLKFVPRQDAEALVRWQMAADALLYINTHRNPLWWCSSPLKVFEYLATGKPLVATNIGSTAEILDESVAFLYDPEAPSSLIRAIQCVLGSDDADERGTRGLARVRLKYTWRERACVVADFAQGGLV